MAGKSDISVLLQTAKLIFTKGLARFIRKDKTGAMCVLGALAEVRFADANILQIDREPILKRIVDGLSLPVHVDYWGSTNKDCPSWRVADWSNTHTQDEVVAGLNNLVERWKVELDGKEA